MATGYPVPQLKALVSMHDDCHIKINMVWFKHLYARKRYLLIFQRQYMPLENVSHGA